MARVLKSIANTVQNGIVMEEDTPGRHEDNKVPVLDMKVWQNEEGDILYQHYQKEMASVQILHAKSAQSMTCKRNVHVQEVLRRLLNSSAKLEWQEVAPVLTCYMTRMMNAGYNESIRKQTLLRAFKIYDKMKKEDSDGIRPIYRPKGWQREERSKKKKSKKHKWSAKGGHVAPIFVPPSPNGELACILRQIADNETEAGVKFKIVETGGLSMKSQVQVSNPTATPGCEDQDCLPCRTGRGDGGNCRKTNIEYAIQCEMCPPDSKAVYLGESSRNLYTRSKEHEENYRLGTRKSFMRKHQRKKHNGQPGSYTAKVTGSYRDCLTRQVGEGVTIRRCSKEILNSKTEWHQPPLWRIQSELYMG